MKEKWTLIKLIMVVFLVNSSMCNLYAQNNDLTVKSIPFTLKTFNSPLNIEIKDDSIIELTSKGKTNLFNSPGNNYYRQNAPMILFHPDSNFIFSTKVKADLIEIYDVAALVLYQNNDLWAKLCFENSIDKEATVVSVVTKRYSDDCNSINITNKYVYLSIAKKGDELSFHCSRDNINWYLVRHFRMEFSNDDLLIGFAVHCSRSDMFSAEFSDIKYSKNVIENMRKYK